LKNPAPSPTDAPPRDVRCTRCAHYFITHDPAFPYGCRALDFKSWRPPMLDVLESSGQPCLYFQAREAGGMG
jgi:hypothetical protein